MKILKLTKDVFSAQEKQNKFEAKGGFSTWAGHYYIQSMLFKFRAGGFKNKSWTVCTNVQKLCVILWKQRKYCSNSHIIWHFHEWVTTCYICCIQSMQNLHQIQIMINYRCCVSAVISSFQGLITPKATKQFRTKTKA